MSTPTNTMTTIDAAQRRLMIAIVVITLVTFALTITNLATGGRPDPPSLRSTSTLLDGAWRFRTGDDPGWARADIDDTRWDVIDMTPLPGSHDGDVGLPDYVAGWMAQGHPGYHGYAWYRRAVTVPASPASWDILGPTMVEDGYELYWNGELLGGSGRLGSHPRVVGSRPMRFALPADAAGERGMLAIRAFMLPRSGVSAGGGGMHSAPILAPQPSGIALHRVQWKRTIAGYIVDVIEPIGMLALIGLALGCWFRSGCKGFLVFACIALALTAVRRLSNAIVAWTDLLSLTTYAALVSLMWVPTVMAWILAWNHWCGRALRSIDLLALALAVVGLIGTMSELPSWTTGSRYGAIALFVVIIVRVVRHGPKRGLALVALITVVAGLFSGELLDPLGVPGIWFPFGIGVSRTQYIYATGLPLIAFLIVHTLLPACTQQEFAGAAMSK